MSNCAALCQNKRQHLLLGWTPFVKSGSPLVCFVATAVLKAFWTWSNLEETPACFYHKSISPPPFSFPFWAVRSWLQLGKGAVSLILSTPGQVQQHVLSVLVIAPVIVFTSSERDTSKETNSQNSLVIFGLLFEYLKTSASGKNSTNLQPAPMYQFHEFPSK